MSSNCGTVNSNMNPISVNESSDQGYMMRFGLALYECIKVAWLEVISNAWKRSGAKCSRKDRVMTVVQGNSHWSIWFTSNDGFQNNRYRYITGIILAPAQCNDYRGWVYLNSTNKAGWMGKSKGFTPKRELKVYKMDK